MIQVLLHHHHDYHPQRQFGRYVWCCILFYWYCCYCCCCCCCCYMNSFYTTIITTTSCNTYNHHVVVQAFSLIRTTTTPTTTNKPTSFLLKKYQQYHPTSDTTYYYVLSFSSLLRNGRRLSSSTRHHHHSIDNNDKKDPLYFERSILIPSKQMSKNNKNRNQKKKQSSLSLSKQRKQQQELVPLSNNNYQYVLGTDESGTGCIAGPIYVVTCCCMNIASLSLSLSTPKIIPNVKDSKLLSFTDCYTIYQLLQQQQYSDQYVYNVTMIEPKDIDTAALQNNIPVHKLINQAMVSSIEAVIDTHLISRINANNNNTTSTEQQLMSQSPYIYSIVDGHRSIDKKEFHNSYYSTIVTCRPYKYADHHIYTVALASCIARYYHEIYMIQLQKVYTSYDFHIHGGYPTKQHIQELYTYGILIPPFNTNDDTTTNNNNDNQTQQYHIHRISTQPVQNILHNSNTNHRDKNQTIHHESITTINNMSAESNVLLLSPSKTAVVSTPTEDITGTTRKSFLTLTFQSILSNTFLCEYLSPKQYSYAMYTDSNNGILFPNIGEIESAIPNDWSIMENPFLTLNGEIDKTLFSRLDNSQDTIFYTEPRFVEHIDPQAVQLITQYIDNIILSEMTRKLSTSDSSKTTISILDLGSSWTSHISTTTSSIPKDRPRIIGLGMNRDELQSNTILTDYVVQDLNTNPILPFADNSFDVILCQLSIDYLIDPFTICTEIARVLSSTSSVYIFFSNRSFISKAVAIWTGKDDIDHVYIVASYLYYCNTMVDAQNNNGKARSVRRPVFTNIQAKDLSKRTKSGRIIGDPLYVISANKATYT